MHSPVPQRVCYAVAAAFTFVVAGISIRAESPIVAVKTAAEGKTKTVRLLTVGNSFSANATHFLGSLAKAGGDVLILREADISGGTMAQHWEKAQLYQHDANDPQGLYNTKRSLKQELLAEPWDFVTIQQASIRSHDVSSYRPYAKQLFDFIKENTPQAEVMLHETWAYRRDDPRFAVASPAAGEPPTQQAMYEGLSKAYATIAAELGLRRIPVGDAFQMANTDPHWGYQVDTAFNFKNAQPPALPDQTHSLNMGWRWVKQKDGRATLGMDGHHANAPGEYLGACVFYETLFRESVVGNSFIPPGIDADYARFLQQTAHSALEKQSAKDQTAASDGAAGEDRVK
jgi:hypothetical protein